MCLTHFRGRVAHIALNERHGQIVRFFAASQAGDRDGANQLVQIFGGGGQKGLRIGAGQAAHQLEKAIPVGKPYSERLQLTDNSGQGLTPTDPRHSLTPETSPLLWGRNIRSHPVLMRMSQKLDRASGALRSEGPTRK